MPTKQIVNKRVKLSLVGRDGNAFMLIGAFRRQAKKEHWTDDEIDRVTDEAMNGNYSHLVATLMDHCENGGFGVDEDDHA